MTTPLQPYDLRAEHRIEPLGLDASSPRLSWKLRSADAARRGLTQASCRVLVASEDLTVWDSGVIGDPDTRAVTVEAPLRPRTRYDWTLIVTDETGAESSQAASWFETGLGDEIERPGAWIGRDLNWDRRADVHDPPVVDDIPDAVRNIEPPGHFRAEFSLERPVRRARMYASAKGVYRAYLNGAVVGDHELAPGWTDYDDRIQYQTYDITDMLHQGANAVGLVVADGWWSGYVGFDHRRHGNHWGVAPEGWAMIVVDHDGGASTLIATDGHWRESPGDIVFTDMLMGEAVDRRRSLGEWTMPGYDDTDWAPARSCGSDFSRLTAQVDEPVRVVDTLSAIDVARDAAGRWIYDFGQNLVGRVRVAFDQLDTGRRVVLRHGETLEDGALYTANLRSAQARDVYTSAGGADVFEPSFTFHGFRYVEIDGLAQPLPLEAVNAIVISSDTPAAGVMRTSSADINQLVSNISWGQRGNFVAVPTDCPQRDERLGWMADAQVFLPTAMYNADLAAFFLRWMRDVRFAQSDEGAFTSVVPPVPYYRGRDGAPGWADAGVIIPWELYRAYGDQRFLTEAYPSMTRWVDFVHRHNPDLIWTRRVGSHYGDWLQIDAVTPRDVLATAYFARSAALTARTAVELGRVDEGARYGALAERIAERFRDVFVDEDLRITGDTQTVYLLALAFDLVQPAQRDRVGAHLARTIEAHGTLLTTGFIGVALLCPVLTAIGRSDLAYALLETDRFPSWLYSVRHGATTIWERWDGWTEDRGFQAPQMNSFNHYSLGSVGEWLYRSVAGIEQPTTSVAYRHLRIRPQIGGSLTWVDATYESAAGRIRSAWRRERGTATVAIEVPPGVRADVVLPGVAVTERGTDLESVPGVSEVTGRDTETSFSVVSGRYEFDFELRTTTPVQR
ncbi:alpha-L-rhamnosidase [Microbacterium dauci]|uniref:alpha-L-rhamnosidase n=1 Tax=Microbacterium dauci TaxID=3048008 RepID=A0ABT6ZE89_9MICO|nr:alpha-L-rhamnosidase [Microbacterium sp. LX3-4]MDJ1114475.1 family 78 glycoside hydrolase catalytic domain [Microbacterium sp. LX3-4]